MKASTVAPADEDLELVAGNVRAVMARARVSASDLSRRYGGAVSYWTRRANAETVFSLVDLERVAAACGVHPAELLGGLPPTGWCAARDSNPEPAGLRTLFWGLAA